ncbi:hypothetical protein L210DRAFT_3476328 [Boletus edulis BED1]|uniref:Distal membrane-arm assembly complex protein 1-like domain-containing protein n=1 Tax=Boletus edulis BED1 TaxID=1328754 RepID=A0AAD4G6Z5_BOLED|nr:hypothetical protein L210DRAFT_3461410 [Boletus edulis BED1]KAF8423957.1 hypothetical protein L210DRAFT_3490074 [Boletus edulis BED1]KAF8443843.1 hypothetical protein L210DRAFT_3476328 [Boletus edulis BED1]
MSGPPRASKSASPSTLSSEEVQQWEYKDCISCKVVGTGALALTGLYALRMARSQAPGTVFGKTMMAGIGVGFLAGSVVRWNMTPTEMLGTFTDQFRHTPR